MPVLDAFLIALAVATAAAWAALSAHVVAVERRRAQARATIQRANELLTRDDVRGLPLAERLVRVGAVAGDASRDLLMREAAGDEARPELAGALAAYVADRWGIAQLERDAAAHRTTRGKWRRMTALKILRRLSHPQMDLLARAAEDPDPDVAAVAFSILSGLRDPRAGDLLIAALTARRHPASRVAIHVDRSPLPLAAALKALATHADPTLRFWAAVLLGRYAGERDLEQVLVRLADDPDPRVRKGAVESLGRVGDEAAARVAVRLLEDPVPFVRANAARALGRLERTDLAPNIASLLGDRDWWVRFAARQALESLGNEVWPVVVQLLSSPDRFVRNGAAEVLQNLGLLDSLILMEAASDDPAPEKIEMLRRIAAAGGVRLTDSLVDRAGPVVGPRVRQLLSVIGLQDVGAA